MAERFAEAYCAELRSGSGSRAELGEPDPLVAVMVATRWLFYFYTVEKCFGVPMHFGMDPDQAVTEFIRILRYGVLPRSAAGRPGPGTAMRRRQPEGEEDMSRSVVEERRMVALVAVLLIAAAPAAAQVSTGTIEVVTKDQDGAALPGVTVQVVQHGHRHAAGGRDRRRRAWRSSGDAARHLPGQRRTSTASPRHRQEGVGCASARPRGCVFTMQGAGVGDHHRHRRGAPGGRAQDRLLDQHRAGADHRPAGARSATSSGWPSSRPASSASAAASASSRTAR